MAALIGTELVFVQAISATGAPAASTELTTTQDIANLGGGGGGGIGTMHIVTTGSTYTALTSTGYVGWDSATAVNKTQIIPASTGSKQLLIIKDAAYTASAYPITITAASGNIDIFPSVDISVSGGSLWLLDTPIGWSIAG